MKMAAVSTISLLLLCCFALSSADSEVKCDHHAATGDNFIVPLEHKLNNSERLTWKHGGTTIIDRRPNNQFISGKREDLDENGSLKLINLTTKNSGTYTPEVFNKEGHKIENFKVTFLCVLDRVPKPKVKIECPKTNVKFTCTAQTQVKGLSYEWLQNNKVLNKTKHSGNTLTLVAETVEKDSFICNVSNLVSFGISEPAIQHCFKRKPIFPEKFLGINTWYFVGAGGGIVLVLIIVLIVCCIRNKRRKRMQLKEEEEFRLAWTNEQQHHQRSHPPNQQQHHHHHQHRQHHHHHQHQQQQPAGHTGPRQHRSKQPRDQQRPRAPDPHGCPPPHGGQPQPSPRRPAQAPRPVDKTDDEQPPPLPQPRKKAPKTPRV